MGVLKKTQWLNGVFLLVLFGAGGGLGLIFCQKLEVDQCLAVWPFSKPHYILDLPPTQ